MPLPVAHYWYPWLPDYAAGVADKPASMATLADSITGAEERAVWLPAARRTLRYRLAPRNVAMGVRMTDMLRAARVTGRTSVPHWGRGRVLAAYAPGSAVITATLAHGLVAGAMAALYRPGDDMARLVEVASVASAVQLTLTAPIPDGWSGIVWIAPVLHGRMQEPSWAALNDLRQIAVEFAEFPPVPAPAPNWEPFEVDESHLWGPRVTITGTDKTASSVVLHGISGYRPAGVEDDTLAPGAPWNAGPIFKWGRRHFSGDYRFAYNACSECPGHLATSGRTDRFYFSGDYQVSQTGVVDTRHTRRVISDDSTICADGTIGAEFNWDEWADIDYHNGYSGPVCNGDVVIVLRHDSALTWRAKLGCNCDTYLGSSTQVTGTAREELMDPVLIENVVVDDPDAIAGVGLCTSRLVSGVVTPRAPRSTDPITVTGSFRVATLHIAITGGRPLSTAVLALKFDIYYACSSCGLFAWVDTVEITFDAAGEFSADYVVTFPDPSPPGYPPAEFITYMCYRSYHLTATY